MDFNVPYARPFVNLYDDFCRLKVKIQDSFPTLWRYVELCLSAIAVLLLKDAVNCVAIIFTGPASSGRTTLLNFFSCPYIKGEFELIYLSDHFTSKSFVSHSANIKKERLSKVDLLPRIKNKVLITPEMASQFAGRKEELLPKFETLTKVLDGQGYMTDSGVHGRRGYRGDYMFVWLGAVREIPKIIWDVLEILGPRLFFVDMPKNELSTEDLIEGLDNEESYIERVKECAIVTKDFLTRLFNLYGGVRSMEFPNTGIPYKVKFMATKLAELLVKLRGSHEVPWRCGSIFFNLLKGRALIHGRVYVEGEDLQILPGIVSSSIPSERKSIFKLLVRKGGEVTVKEVEDAFDVSNPTAVQILREFKALEIVNLSGGTGNKPLRMELKDKWFLTDEFKKLIKPRS
jgi:hypothetical protein